MSIDYKKPIALIRNHKFPTYQLYAQITRQNLAVERQFKLAVLVIMDWLKERFREFDELPLCLNVLPKSYELEQLDNFNLQSYKNDIGYNFEIKYLKHDDEQYWAFQLQEPDLGLSTQGNRPAVIGRTFETNVALHLRNDVLELGVKIVCLDPVDSKADCDVFRPLFVLRLFNHPELGLDQCGEDVDLTDMHRASMEICNAEELEALIKLIINPQRQLPIILVTENDHQLTASEQLEISTNPNHNIDYDKIFSTSSYLFDNEVMEDLLNHYTEKLNGFAWIYQVPVALVSQLIESLYAKGIKSVGRNQMTMISPLGINDLAPVIKAYDPQERSSTKEDQIVEDTINYHKNNHSYNYGGIRFIKDVQALRLRDQLQKKDNQQRMIKELETTIQQMQHQFNKNNS